MEVFHLLISRLTLEVFLVLVEDFEHAKVLPHFLSEKLQNLVRPKGKRMPPDLWQS